MTKDVPDHAVVTGVPARQSGWVCECGQSLGPVSDTVICRRCSRSYRLEDGALMQESA